MHLSNSCLQNDIFRTVAIRQRYVAVSAADKRWLFVGISTTEICCLLDAIQTAKSCHKSGHKWYNKWYKKLPFGQPKNVGVFFWTPFGCLLVIFLLPGILLNIVQKQTRLFEYGNINVSPPSQQWISAGYPIYVPRYPRDASGIFSRISYRAEMPISLGYP